MSSQAHDIGAQPDVVTTLRLPADQHRALRAIAESNHRTFVGEVRHLIAGAIAAHETEAPAPAPDLRAAA